MKIIQINSNDIKGGATLLAYNLHLGLKKRGIWNKMLVGKKFSEDLEVEAIYGQGIIERLYKQMLNAINILTANQFAYYPASRILKSKSYSQADIVHLHNLHGYYFNLKSLKKISKDKKIIWTLHDMWSFTGQCAYDYDCGRFSGSCGACPHLDDYPGMIFDRTKKMLQKKKKIYDDIGMTVVVPSRWLKNKVENGILKEKKIELIYNGVDTEIFFPFDKNEARKELGLPLNKKIVCFVAYRSNDNFRKGGVYIEEILKRTKDDNIFFLNIGGKTDSSSNNFVSIGHISDPKILAKYYSASDILLFPSMADNCPLVILEAMACGLPVVAFNTGGVPELVVHNETGLISAYKDIDDFEKNMKDILKDDILRNKMSESAVERSRKYFSFEQMIEKYDKLYRNL